MAAAPAKTGGGVKARLTRKVGPLPVYGWAIGILAAYLLYRHYRGSAGGSSVLGGTSLTPDTGGGMSGGAGMDSSGSPTDIGANSGTDPQALYQALLASEQLNSGLFGLYAAGYPASATVSSTSEPAMSGPVTNNYYAPVPASAPTDAVTPRQISGALAPYAGEFVVPALASHPYDIPTIVGGTVSWESPSTASAGDAQRASAARSAAIESVSNQVFEGGAVASPPPPPSSANYGGATPLTTQQVQNRNKRQAA